MSNAANSNGITSKWKNILRIFFCISGSYIILGILWKKRWASEVISYLYYTLPKAGLLKWLKSPVSEHVWTVNMLMVQKIASFSTAVFLTYFWSLGKEISSENSALLVSETLRLFVNILTPDDKYSLSVKAIDERYQFRCNYLKLK